VVPERLLLYWNGWIIRAIQELFFTGRTSSFAYHFGHRFPWALYMNKAKKEAGACQVPAAMVAMVSTMASIQVLIFITRC
jgi:hypothetical protein